MELGCFLVVATLADKQVGGPRQLGVPQCFFPLPSRVGNLYGISQGWLQGILPILQCLHDSTMYFDSNVKIARHQLGRSYDYAMLIITYADIIMANINSFTT